MESLSGTLGSLASANGEATFAAAWAEGRARKLEQAIEYPLKGCEVDVLLR